MQAPTYKGEAMLLRWSENSANGRTVTFTIEDGPDSTKEHPFKGLHCGKGGQRFAIVAVPLGESEHPNFSNEPEPKPEKPKKPFNQMSRAQQAGILCADKQFQKWLSVSNEPDPEEAAKEDVYRTCKVQSRTMLDHIAWSGQAWDALVSRYRIATGQQAEPR